MKVLVSVIIPVYKVERYLKRCIESVQKQTYKNIEIILVDDGSPDRCGQICDEFAKKDARIKVIHKKNGGLSDARNAGIAVASGEYIVFVDSDDYLAERMVELLLDAVKVNRTKMAICNFLCVDEKDQSTGESDYSPIKNEVLDAKEVLRRFYQSKGWFYIVAWNRLYHRSLLTKDTFPIGRIHEDEFTAAPLVWNAGKIACIEYQGYYYVRQRAGSITANEGNGKHLDAYFALVERYKFYQKIGCTDLLYETQARVYELLKRYFFHHKEYGEKYIEKIQKLQFEYEKLTDIGFFQKFKYRMMKNILLLKRIFKGY